MLPEIMETLQHEAQSLDLAITQLSEITSTMPDLLDIAYSYKPTENGMYRNTTLFEDFITIDDGSELDTIEHQFQSKIKEISQQLSKVDQLLDTTSKAKIIRGQIDYISQVLNIAQLGLPFELEKMGISSNMTSEQKKLRVKEIQKSEEVLFGSLVIDNPVEVRGSITLLSNLLAKNKENIELKEYDQFSGYISLLEPFATKSDSLAGNLLGNMDQHNELATHNPVLLEKSFDASAMAEVFEKVYKIYGIQKKVVISSEHTSISNTDALYIPSIGVVNFSGLLKLIQHEIETHSIIEKNNSQLLGKIKGPKYLFKEEGVAKVMEKMMGGTQPELGQVTVSIPQIALGEVLDGDEFKNFMRLYWKLKGKEDRHEGYWLRRKRNYPMDAPGVQHKDTAYSRGAQQVIQSITNGEEPIQAFYNKVSLEDMRALSRAHGENTYMKPLLIGELVYYTLLQPDGKLTKEGFKSYIADKYDFLDEKDITGELSFSQKKELISLLSTVKA